MAGSAAFDESSVMPCQGGSAASPKSGKGEEEQVLDPVNSGHVLLPPGGRSIRMQACRRWSTLKVCALATCILALVTLCSSIMAARLMKDSHISPEHELVSADGVPVLTNARVMHSYSALTDLPMQSQQFLEQMMGISLWRESELLHFRIAGFRWRNASYMVLQTLCQKEIVLAGGRAYLRERLDGRLLTKHVTTPASEPECGRRLSPVNTVASASGRPARYEDLVERYTAEISQLASGAGRRWRRLEEEPLAGQADMFEWFGALISSEVAAAEHSDQASEALRAAYCDYDIRGLECAAFESAHEAEPPKLSPDGYNRFLLAGGGSTWLLYLDLSDWNRDRDTPAAERIVRSKLAEGIFADTADETGTAIRVVENHGSQVWSYQMLHPALHRANSSFDAGAADGGITLAEALLESANKEDEKGECRRTSMHSVSESPQSADVNLAFDCDSGTYMWSVGGWRVMSSADGTIREFIFGNSSALDLPGDDDSAARMHFRVLSQTDGGNARTNFLLNRAFSEGWIFGGCDPGMPQTHAMGGRNLRSGSSNSNSSSSSGGRRLLGVPGVTLGRSNWCGMGQDPSRDNFCLEDFDGDWACRRHDSCSRVDHLWLVLSFTSMPVPIRVPVNGCSCDRDLYRNRGSGPNAVIITGLFGDYGVLPCVAYEKDCWNWGWVPYGRRRRWGSSYWGVTHTSRCSKWNYYNKYAGRLKEWPYDNPPNSNDLNSKKDWPGCKDNLRDVSVDMSENLANWFS